MATRRRTKGNPVPLIAESHPPEYNGYPFITLLQYNRAPILTIVDFITDKHIKAFSLDLCAPENVDELEVIDVAKHWYDNNREDYPLSFEFARLGIAEQFSRIYRTFNVEFVARAVGPLPKFKMNGSPQIRRRRRKPLSPGIEIQEPTITFTETSFGR